MPETLLNKAAWLRCVQDIAMLKQVNFLTEMQRNKNKTQICEQIRCNEKSSSFLQMNKL